MADMCVCVCTHREELQVIFAQVASGFGRDPVLNAGL
jgi:hypothetical protein